ncbi:hypothetical protein BASA84_001227 [Batrachochytrium salamandrivorans]|nr:hypothetical protein BASA84_001227 [Batrachochytrium salamandrivorans]
MIILLRKHLILVKGTVYKTRILIPGQSVFLVPNADGRKTPSDTTPLASVAGSVCMRSTDSDRSVRATPKKVRKASPPLQDDLRQRLSSRRQQPALKKVLSNMASQVASTSKTTQTALAVILARMKAGPVVPKVVVPNNKDYPPLPPMDANPKSKTMATKPNSTTTTTTATDTTTSTGQPSKNT